MSQEAEARLQRSMAIINILSIRVPESCEFYSSLFGFEIVADYVDHVRLESPDLSGIQLRIWRREQTSFPKAREATTQAIFTGFLVDDAEQIRKAAIQQRLRIQPKASGPGGALTRFLIADPNGLLVDVSSRTWPASASSEKKLCQS